MSQFLLDILIRLGLAKIDFKMGSPRPIVIIKTISGAPVETGFLSEINIKKVASKYHVHLRCIERKFVLCYSMEKGSSEWLYLNDPDSHGKESSFPVSVEFITSN